MFQYINETKDLLILKNNFNKLSFEKLREIFISIETTSLNFEYKNKILEKFLKEFQSYLKNQDSFSNEEYPLLILKTLNFDEINKNWIYFFFNEKPVLLDIKIIFIFWNILLNRKIITQSEIIFLFNLTKHFLKKSNKYSFFLSYIKIK